MNPLSAKRRSELRAEAHKLNPTVIIGDKGLTAEVLAEIDRSLKAHELIKVRAATDERDARDLWYDEICLKLAAHAVQQIGKVLVVYRENPEEKPRAGTSRKPREGAPAAEPASSGTQRRRTRKPDASRTLPEAPRGSARPRSRTPAPLPASGPRRRPRNTSR